MCLVDVKILRWCESCVWFYIASRLEHGVEVEDYIDNGEVDNSVKLLICNRWSLLVGNCNSR